MRCKKGREYEIDQKNYCLCMSLSILLSIGSSAAATAVTPVEQEYPAHITITKNAGDLEQKGVQIKHVKDSSLR